MNQESNSQINTEDWRNEQAKELKELRNAGRHLDAIRYLGMLEESPEYKTARIEHKNMLATASNERMAEEVISDLLALAIVNYKKLNLITSRVIALDSRVGKQEEHRILDTEDNMRDSRYLEEICVDIKERENAGASRDDILSELAQRVKELEDESKAFEKQSLDALVGFLSKTRVTDVTSAVMSWFDVLSNTLKKRRSSELHDLSYEKSIQCRLLQDVIEEAQKDSDLNVSIFVERLVLKLKKLTQLELQTED